MKPIDAVRLQLKAMELVEGTELEWWEVIRDKTSKKAFNYHPALDCHVSQYELALGVIKGKPVWEGDQIYTSYNRKFVAHEEDRERLDWAACTWLPPTPKTAMVELLVGDIEYWIKLGNTNPGTIPSIYVDASNRFYAACRKTLEGLK